MNTVVGRNALLAYDNGAIELNAYRGDFQARFQGEDTFRYRDLILDYDWPKYDMREFAFYGHPRASVDDSQWHLFAAAYDAEGKFIGGESSEGQEAWADMYVEPEATGDADPAVEAVEADPSADDAAEAAEAVEAVEVEAAEVVDAAEVVEVEAAEVVEAVEPDPSAEDAGEAVEAETTQV